MQLLKEINMKAIRFIKTINVMKTGILGITITVLSIPFVANASNQSLLNIQHQWAACQYEIVNTESKENCFQHLIEDNEQALSVNPKNNELKVWLAINKSSLAGAKGGLGALSLVKQAKLLFEEVIADEPTTLNGSAYTSLGSLYYQVPGWPIGFGSDDKAEIMLQKALAVNPDGIDSNYFYADFLREDGRKTEAIKYFKKAQQAIPRPNRPLADKGRQQEIQGKLEELM